MGQIRQGQKMKNLILQIVLFLSVVVVLPCYSEESVQLNAWNKIDHGALVIDVRAAEDYETGHIDGAINIPYDQIERRVSELGSDKSREIVLYCRSGRRAGIALNTLKELGFSSLTNAGGFADLIKAKQ